MGGIAHETGEVIGFIIIKCLIIIWAHLVLLQFPAKLAHVFMVNSPDHGLVASYGGIAEKEKWIGR